MYHNQSQFLLRLLNQPLVFSDDFSKKCKYYKLLCNSQKITLIVLNKCWSFYFPFYFLAIYANWLDLSFF